MSLSPRLDILPPPQRALWPELARVPKGFVLYGGTALALRLGHRSSVDFDFFCSDALDHRGLQALAFFRGSQVLQEQADALTVSVDRDGPVKLSFFGPVAFGRVGSPDPIPGHFPVASLLDLGATKLKALLQRVEAKDYLDVAALLEAGIPLADLLRGGRALFGDAFNPLVAKKALSYFEGGDLGSLDPSTRELLSRAAVEDVELPPLPTISARLEA